MKHPKSELEDFDDLFERIDMTAEPEYIGVSIAETNENRAASVSDPSELTRKSGTRLTEWRIIGREAVRFMLFSSDLICEEKDQPLYGKPLYSPSITVIRGGKPNRIHHVKRRELELQPTGDQAIARKKLKAAELADAEWSFKRYENPVLRFFGNWIGKFLLKNY